MAPQESLLKKEGAMSKDCGSTFFFLIIPKKHSYKTQVNKGKEHRKL